MLPDQAITEYQQIYKKHFGKPIDRKRATEQANKFVQLVLIIEEPVKNENEKLHENTK